MRKVAPTLLNAFLQPILVGILIGSAVCVVMLFLFAFTATLMDIPAAIVVPLAIVAVTISAFVGGFIAAKIAKKNGWLFGILTSFLLFLLSWISGWSFFKMTDGGFMIIKLVIMLASGTLGGIMAVNSGKRRR